MLRDCIYIIVSLFTNSFQSNMKLLRLSEENVVDSNPAEATQATMYHDRYTAGETTGGLSVIFTMMCIIDLFGVFPVVALPKSIISCGMYF